MNEQQDGGSTGGQEHDAAGRDKVEGRRLPSWLLPALLLVVVGVAVWAFLFRPNPSARVDRLMATARQAMAAQDYATAEKCLLEARRHAPKNGILLHNLAVVYVDQDRLDDARAAFERAASLYGPEANHLKAEELYQLAQLSFRESKWQQVASELEQAIAADPTRGQLHMRLVDLQLGQLRDQAAADSSVSRFLRLCGRTGHNLAAAAYVHYREGSYARAEELGRQAVALVDSMTSTHALIAKSMWKAKRIEAGRRYLEGPLQRYPRSAELWVAEGSLLAGAQRHAEAIATLDRALEIDPKNYAAHYARLVALTGAKRLQEALREVEDCRKLTDDPNEQRALQSRQGDLRQLLGAEKGAAPTGEMQR